MLDYEIVNDDIDWDPQVGDRVKILEYSFPRSGLIFLDIVDECPSLIGTIESIHNNYGNHIYKVNLISTKRLFTREELEFIYLI